MEDQMTKYIRLDEVAPDRWDRDLDAAKDWARGGARDGDRLFKPYDMQAKPSHTSRPETGQYGDGQTNAFHYRPDLSTVAGSHPSCSIRGRAHRPGEL